MKKRKIAILAAEFHKEIIDIMVAEAKRSVEKYGGEVSMIVRVPGCFEVPLAAKKLLRKKDIDALVVLGYIERGETLHGEVMGNVVYHSLMQLQLEYMKPIGFGIIGPGATVTQARKRMKGAAHNAVGILFHV